MTKLKKAIKYSLIFIDTILAITGIVVLVLRALFFQIKSNFLGLDCFIAQDFISVIVFGVLVKTFALFGIFAAAKKNKKLLVVYSILMSLLVFGALGLSLHFAIFREQKANFDLCNQSTYASDLKLNSTSPTKRDFYQTKYECCGWNGLEDYRLNQTNFEIPLSCCKSMQNKCLNAYSTPCSQKLVINNDQWKTTLYLILLTFCLLTLLSIWLSLVLTYFIGRKKKSSSPVYYQSSSRSQFIHT